MNSAPAFKANSQILPLIILFLIGFRPVQASVDSLKNELRLLEIQKKELGTAWPQIQDTTLINLMNKISLALPAEQYKSKKFYAEKALLLSESIKCPDAVSADGNGNGYGKGMAAALYTLNVYEQLYGSPTKAFTYNKKGLEIAQRIGDKNLIGRGYFNLGALYHALNNIIEASKTYHSALKIGEQIHDTALIIRSNNHLGIIAIGSGYFKKAVGYYRQAIPLAVSSGDAMLPELYYNMYSSLQGMNDHTSKLYIDSCLKVARNSSNLYWIAYASMIRAEEKANSKDFTAALQYADTSFNYFLKHGIKDDIIGIQILTADIWLKYFRHKNNPAFIDSSEKYLQATYDYSYSTGYHFALSRYYDLSHQIGMLKNDFRVALENYKKHVQYRDSSMYSENKDELQQISFKYELDKKESLLKAAQEKERLILNAKLQRQRYSMYVITGGLVLGGLYILLLVRRAREKKEATLILEATNTKLNSALSNLKSAQEQLVISEKMAAFGTLASRMAHEIMNPLNFVRNFSESSKQIVKEIQESGDDAEKELLTGELANNLELVLHHGNRVEKLIQSLQQHINRGTVLEYFEEGEQKV